MRIAYSVRSINRAGICLSARRVKWCVCSSSHRHPAHYPHTQRMCCLVIALIHGEIPGASSVLTNAHRIKIYWEILQLQWLECNGCNGAEAPPETGLGSNMQPLPRADTFPLSASEDLRKLEITGRVCSIVIAVVKVVLAVVVALVEVAVAVVVVVVVVVAVYGWTSRISQR